MGVETDVAFKKKLKFCVEQVSFALKYAEGGSSYLFAGGGTGVGSSSNMAKADLVATAGAFGTAKSVKLGFGSSGILNFSGVSTEIKIVWHYKIKNFEEKIDFEPEKVTFSKRSR